MVQALLHTLSFGTFQPTYYFKNKLLYNLWEVYNSFSKDIVYRIARTYSFNVLRYFSHSIFCLVNNVFPTSKMYQENGTVFKNKILYIIFWEVCTVIPFQRFVYRTTVFIQYLFEVFLLFNTPKWFKTLYIFPFS